MLVQTRESRHGSLINRYLPVKPSKPALDYIPPMAPSRSVVEERLARNRAIPMKNGKHRVVLLAGCTRHSAKDVREDLADTRAMYVKYHWDIEKRHHWDKPIPADVDLVICTKDALSHDMFVKVKGAAKRAGVPIIITQRKSSIMRAALHNYGIGKTSETLNISMAVFDDDLWEQAAKDEAAAPVEAAAPAPVEEEATQPAAPALTLVEPVPSPLEVPTFVAQQVAIPIEIPVGRKGIPSPRLAAAAAMVMLMCADEGISVLITGKELNFTAA